MAIDARIAGQLAGATAGLLVIYYCELTTATDTLLLWMTFGCGLVFLWEHDKSNRPPPSQQRVLAVQSPTACAGG